MALCALPVSRSAIVGLMALCITLWPVLFPISEATYTNIELLKSEKTYTITTGHQLNLFTGPAYFLYKIASTINLCKQLKETYSEYNFVPVYWMATEDHDFEEINHFNLKEKISII